MSNNPPLTIDSYLSWEENARQLYASRNTARGLLRFWVYASGIKEIELASNLLWRGTDCGEAIEAHNRILKGDLPSPPHNDNLERRLRDLLKVWKRVESGRKTPRDERRALRACQKDIEIILEECAPQKKEG